MADVHMKLTVAEQIDRDVGSGARLRIFALGGHTFRGVLEAADEEQVVIYSDQPPSDSERVCIPTEKVVAFSRLTY
jgi:hypothetical protein